MSDKARKTMTEEEQKYYEEFFEIPLPTDLTELTEFFKINKEQTEENNKDTQKKVYFLLGPPGIGKSRYISELGIEEKDLVYIDDGKLREKSIVYKQFVSAVQSEFISKLQEKLQKKLPYRNNPTFCAEFIEPTTLETFKGLNVQGPKMLKDNANYTTLLKNAVWNHHTAKSKLPLKFHLIVAEALTEEKHFDEIKTKINDCIGKEFRVHLVFFTDTFSNVKKRGMCRMFDEIKEWKPENYYNSMKHMLLLLDYLKTKNVNITHRDNENLLKKYMEDNYGTTYTPIEEEDSVRRDWLPENIDSLETSPTEVKVNVKANTGNRSVSANVESKKTWETKRGTGRWTARAAEARAAEARAAAARSDKDVKINKIITEIIKILFPGETRYIKGGKKFRKIRKSTRKKFKKTKKFKKRKSKRR